MDNEPVNKSERRLKPIYKILLAAMGLMTACCIALVAWYSYDMSTPKGQATATAIAAKLAVTRAEQTAIAVMTVTEAAKPTNTVPPTDTPIPTKTLPPTGTALPTSTSTPTNTPIPSSTPNLAPPFSEIAENYNRMTDAQWEAYAELLRGALALDWEGTIREVDKGEIFGGYKVIIDAGRDTFVPEVYIDDVPEALALSLNKGARVRFSGVINYASNTFGLTIQFDGDTVTITTVDSTR